MPHANHDAFGPHSRSILRTALAAFAFVALCAAATPTKKTPPAQPIDLNVATVKELEELPGVGPTTAKAIVEFRTKSGRFRRVNDLLAIRGISEGKLPKMRPYVTVGAPPSAPAKKPAPSPSQKPKAQPTPKPAPSLSQ